MSGNIQTEKQQIARKLRKTARPRIFPGRRFCRVLLYYGFLFFSLSEGIRYAFVAGKFGKSKRKIPDGTAQSNGELRRRFVYAKDGRGLGRCSGSAVEIGKHHGFCVENAKIAAEIFVFGRSAGDACNLSVQAKPCSERAHQFFRQTRVEIAENPVESDAVNVYVERIPVRGDVNELQFVSGPALGERALAVGRFYAVRLAVQREGQSIFPAAETQDEFSEKCVDIHIVNVPYLRTNVNGFQKKDKQYLIL